MKPHRLSVFASLFLGAVALGQLPTIDPPRGWMTAEGAPFQASLLGFDGTTALFRLANGSRAQAPLVKLSAEDQAYIAEWQKKQPIKADLPDMVSVETSAINTEIVLEDAAAERYVYRTQNFEYESQGKFGVGMLREIGRNFEATFELLKALPWGIDPKPASGTHFKAKLLKNRESYMAAGGIPNSGGVYSSRTETFLVPFESIGLKPYGKGYKKDDNFDTSTMVHELTHQMMHFWLNLLPQWVVEGTAEYTSNLPLKAGRFRPVAAKTGLKDYVDFLRKRAVGGMPEPFPLEKLFFITNEEWSETLASDPLLSRRMYFTSYLLVYYFMHLDGKRDGQRFIRFFREVGEARKQLQQYRLALKQSAKQPATIVNPDGSVVTEPVRYPEPPSFIRDPKAMEEFSKRTLDILLDGRTPEQLMKEIRLAYSGLGIKL